MTDILGETVFERGMTTRQIEYFFRACQSVEAERIQRAMVTTTAPYADKESGKKTKMSLESMKNTLPVWLLKEDLKNG